VRPGVAADAAEITRLRGVMFEAMGVVDADGGRWRALCEVVLADALTVGGTAAFVVDGRAGGLVSCGLATVSQRLPGPAVSNGLHGYIHTVATDPGHRRRGHARAVMAALLGWLAERGVAAMDLHATPDGEPLYRSLGFAERSTGGRELVLRR
jgi:ribosomal protein S18 acetylase RimI-like enzyme